MKTCAALVILGLTLVPATALAQQPVAYWLYVEGNWKSSYKVQADCEAAGKASEKAYQCRPVGGTITGGGPGDKWSQDVAYCSGSTGVDAFVSGKGEAKTAGTARERLAFQKCMTDRGHMLK